MKKSLAISRVEYSLRFKSLNLLISSFVIALFLVVSDLIVNLLNG